MPRATALLALLAALVLAACGDDDRQAAARDGTLRVVASFAPLEEIARAVGGDRARVTGLTPPGQGPHGVELRAPELRALEEADLVLFLGAGFQPAVEEAVGALGDDATAADLLRATRLRAVDDPVRGVRGEVDGEVVRGDRDPHVWLDPVRFGALVSEAERAFAAADPAGARAYARNADAYRARLAELHRAFAAGLRRCASRTLVTSHAAFGYLADRYGLEQAPIAGISPDDEPDPRSLEATARRARADGVKTVFFESLVPRDLAETVAREIGARTDMLDPVEGLSREDLAAGRGYVDVQRENLARLREGLGCTG